MTRKRDDNSPKTKAKADLKNPDRRHLLGAAALAAVTAGQVASAATYKRPKKPPTHRTVTCPPTPPSHPGHGGLVGAMSGANNQDIGHLASQNVFEDAQAYRAAVSKYAADLRAAMNLNDPTEFDHIVRLRWKKGPQQFNNKSGDCGCGCS